MEGAPSGWAQPLSPREGLGGPEALGARRDQVGRAGPEAPDPEPARPPGTAGARGPGQKYSREQRCCSLSEITRTHSTAPGSATTAVLAQRSSRGTARGAGRGHRQPHRSPAGTASPSAAPATLAAPGAPPALSTVCRLGSSQLGVVTSSGGHTPAGQVPRDSPGSSRSPSPHRVPSPLFPVPSPTPSPLRTLFAAAARRAAPLSALPPGPARPPLPGPQPCGTGGGTGTGTGSSLAAGGRRSAAPRDTAGRQHVHQGGAVWVGPGGRRAGVCPRGGERGRGRRPADGAAPLPPPARRPGGAALPGLSLPRSAAAAGGRCRGRGLPAFWLFLSEPPPVLVAAAPGAPRCSVGQLGAAKAAPGSRRENAGSGGTVGIEAAGFAPRPTAGAIQPALCAGAAACPEGCGHLREQRWRTPCHPAGGPAVRWCQKSRCALLARAAHLSPGECGLGVCVSPTGRLPQYTVPAGSPRCWHSLPTASLPLPGHGCCNHHVGYSWWEQE